MIMTNSRNKGVVGEREFSNLCKDHGFETRRSQQYAGINNDADVVGIPGLHLEVKRVEAFSLYKAMKQAIRDKTEEEVPVVAHRKNREEWVVVLRAEDFLEMYKQVLDKGECKCSGECRH
jgi:Holliday junction resolvase